MIAILKIVLAENFENFHVQQNFWKQFKKYLN